MTLASRPLTTAVASAFVGVVIGLGIGPTVVSPASAATGSIAGGTANPTWTQGHVDNLRLTMDLCGSDGQPTCKWNAVAGVMPAANGSCPSDWAFPGDSELDAFWATPNQTANGTINSGPKDFVLNGAHGQRVCLYLERTFTGTGASASFIQASKLLVVDSGNGGGGPAPPAVDPQACEDAEDALGKAKRKLRNAKDSGKKPKIKKAKRKVKKAKQRVEDAC